jgi:hypothetical protein
MDNPHGLDWMRHLATPIAGRVSATVGEEGQVYVLNMESFTAFYVSSEGQDASEYTEIEGQWKHIDAGKGALWAVNLYDEVFQRLGVSEDLWTGTSWEQVPGRQRFVSSAEEGIVWAIDPEDDVWILKTGDISTETYVDNIEEGWTLIENYAGNTLIQVDSGYNSQLVGVNAEGRAYYRTGIAKATPMGDGWSNVFNQQNYLFLHITMCDNGMVWATDTTHLIHYRAGVNDNNPVGDSW